MGIDFWSRHTDETKPCETEPGIRSPPNDSPPASEVDQIVDMALRISGRLFSRKPGFRGLPGGNRDSWNRELVRFGGPRVDARSRVE